MNETELIGRLLRLRRAPGRGTQAGQEAPHKPILLLAAISQVQSGQRENTFPFREIKPEFDRLWEKYGWTTSTRASYPFWYLVGDGVWIVADRSGHRPKRGTSPPPDRVLEADGYVGAFAPRVWDHLKDGQTRRRVIDALILNYFPVTVQSELRMDLRLAWTPPSEVEPGAEAVVLVRRRNPAEQAKFRDSVMNAYEARCAVCGFGPRDARPPSAIEAAHVWPWEEGGPSELENGLALCPIHHWALDSGSMAFQDDGTILVSSVVKDGETMEEFVRRYSGRKLRRPLGRFPAPAPRWVKAQRECRFLGIPLGG